MLEAIFVITAGSVFRVKSAENEESKQEGEGKGKDNRKTFIYILVVMAFFCLSLPTLKKESFNWMANEMEEYCLW